MSKATIKKLLRSMSKVKRIEVLDGAASALYGSDAIGGVINIITDEKTMDKVVASSDTRLSGKGQFSEGVNLDVTSKYLDSHTSYFHQEADSYQNNNMAVDADGTFKVTAAFHYIEDLIDCLTIIETEQA
jgi:outer membrane cobalamin receptor